MEDEIRIRVYQLKATRDKCGISPDDKESEPNKYIEPLLKICEQVGIKI